MDEEKNGVEEGKAMDQAESKFDYDETERKMMDQEEFDEGKAGDLDDGLGLDEDFGGTSSFSIWSARLRTAPFRFHTTLTRMFRLYATITICRRDSALGK